MEKMSILVSVGAYKSHSAGEPDGASPWSNGEPPDVKCALCQEDITEAEFAAGNVEWPSCGHFGHKQCPGYDDRLGYENLSKCPVCKKSLGHAAVPVVEDAEQMAAFRADESRRYMERMAAEIERARSDKNYWNSITATERVAIWNHIESNGIEPLPYTPPEEYDYEEPPAMGDAWGRARNQLLELIKDSRNIEQLKTYFNQFREETQRQFANYGDDEGTPLIILFDQYGNIPDYKEMLLFLCERGADVKLKDKYGSNVLHYACAYGDEDIDVIKYLLGKGLDVNDTNNYGQTPLFYSVHILPERETMKLLIEKGADVNIRDSNGKSPLMTLCSDEQALHNEEYDDDFVQGAKILIENGANVNAEDMSGTTPLIYASQNVYKFLIKFLIDSGAEINHKNPSGLTALSSSCFVLLHDCVQVLLENSADVNMEDDDGETALFQAILTPNNYLKDDIPRIIDLLLSKGASIDHQDNNGNSTLQKALINDIPDLNYRVDILLKKGASVNLQNHRGSTPLIQAARKDHVEAVKLLLDKGAQINTQNMYGITALHMATKHGFTHSVRLLLEYRADIHIKNNKGKTALDLAIQDSKQDIIHLLEGADVSRV